MLAFQLLCALSSVSLLVSAGPPLIARHGRCDASRAVMDLPPNQTALVSPATPPIFVMLGVGIQNYTCTSATSTFASIGAVASLFDLSCLDTKPVFSNIQTHAFNIWDKASPKTTANSIGRLVDAPTLLGFHYFINSPTGTGLSPVWDFRSKGAFAGNATAFVVGAKVGDILAPSDPATNIDWLALTNIEGDLASNIFRIDTVGGQPPTSCVPGSDPISVKYTAKYYLF
ncbi:hypothetical protein C8R44DRAFT_734821 [Mycena epipterygia]|nr:hypothetical protein C8R44DRAFT_734821 [Mycena epipterygia]